MTNDDFDKVDEDFASEFDFVDDQNQEPTGTPPAGNTPQPDKPKPSQQIVSIIVILCILGGGYYAYKHFFGSEKVEPPAPIEDNALPKIPAPEDTIITEVPTEMSTEINPQQHVDFGSNQKDDLSAAIPQSKSFEQVQRDLHAQQQQQQQQQQFVVPAEFHTAIQNISEEMTINVNHIKQLENTITSLSNTIVQLNKTINAMDNRILSLTETVDSLSQDLANVKKVMIDEDMDLTSPGSVKFSNKKQPQTVNSSSPSYTVHAIIPGRAWLKSSSGQIITVTEGDKVGDYGTVAVIDSANGLVRTSSGIIIK